MRLLVWRTRSRQRRATYGCVSIVHAETPVKDQPKLVSRISRNSEGSGDAGTPASSGTRHRFGALGFTQYEPKPAGRGPDARACSGSQQRSTWGRSGHSPQALTSHQAETWATQATNRLSQDLTLARSHSLRSDSA